MVFSIMNGFQPLHKACEEADIGLFKDGLLAEYVVFQMVGEGY